jgi:hypothetical protein
MARKPLPFYPHRQNPDGSFDSICLRCFATVATAMEIGQLRSYDKVHVCDATSIAHRRAAQNADPDHPSRPRAPGKIQTAS